MATLVMMKGLPCSGKTDWAMKWVAAKAGRIRVSWTEILQLMGRGPSRLLRPLAVDAACRLVSLSLRQGCDVVLDERNLVPAEFIPFLTRAELANANVVWQNMNRTAAQCKAVNAKKGYPVRDMEIERLATRWSEWLKEK